MSTSSFEKIVHDRLPAAVATVLCCGGSFMLVISHTAVRLPGSLNRTPAVSDTLQKSHRDKEKWIDVYGHAWDWDNLSSHVLTKLQLGAPLRRTVAGGRTARVARGVETHQD